MRFFIYHIFFISLLTSFFSSSCRRSYDVSGVQVTTEMLAKTWYLDSINTVVIQNGTKTSSTQKYRDGSYYKFDIGYNLEIYQAPSFIYFLHFTHPEDYLIWIEDSSGREKYDIEKLTSHNMILHHHKSNAQYPTEEYYYLSL